MPQVKGQLTKSLTKFFGSRATVSNDIESGEHDILFISGKEMLNDKNMADFIKRRSKENAVIVATSAVPQFLDTLMTRNEIHFGIDKIDLILGMVSPDHMKEDTRSTLNRIMTSATVALTT